MSAPAHPQSPPDSIILKNNIFRNQRLIAQEWLPHPGYLLKVYVLDDKWHVMIRPSISPDSWSALTDNTTMDDQLIFVDSQKIPKRFAAGKCAQMAPPPDFAPDRARIQKIVDAVRATVPGLHLFGLDIIPADDGRWYVVDLNYFPSYDGMPDFETEFIAFLKRCCHR